MQDAAYSTLLRSRRQQLHARIVTTLEEPISRDRQRPAGALAQHCAEAGLTEKAVDYWLKAGQQAIARSAMTEAVAQLQKGFDLLKSMPDNSARQQRELDLRIALGQALVTTKGNYAPTLVVRLTPVPEQLCRAARSPRYCSAALRPIAFHLLRGELQLALSASRWRDRATCGEAAMVYWGRTQHGAVAFLCRRVCGPHHPRADLCL